jgi:hypothetical protein
MPGVQAPCPSLDTALRCPRRIHFVFHLIPEIGMNSLMMEAIKKLLIVPYILVVDGWRSAIFNGSTNPDDFNRKWWEMR